MKPDTDLPAAPEQAPAEHATPWHAAQFGTAPARNPAVVQLAGRIIAGASWLDAICNKKPGTPTT